MCKGCKKYYLSEVDFKYPVLDLGKWIKFPEVPVAAGVDQGTKDLVITGVILLVVGAIAVAAISKT